MPMINISYDIFGDDKNIKSRENIKKKVYFDIIGGLPPIPSSLPSLYGIKKKEAEKMWYDINLNYSKKFIIPFSHPLEFLIGIPPDGIRKFSLQLYAYGKMNHYTRFHGNYYNISWEITRKRRKGNSCYYKIWDMEKYLRLWNFFSGNFHIPPSSYEFLVQLFILIGEYKNESYTCGNVNDEDRKGFYDKDTGVLSPSYTQLYETIFPEFIHTSHVTLHFSHWFKKDEFFPFSLDYSTVKAERKKYFFSPFHIQNFDIR